MLFLKSPSELDCEDCSLEDESSPLGTSLTGNPLSLEVVMNLFFACEAKGKLGWAECSRTSTHLEQKLSLEICGTRQPFDVLVRLHLVKPPTDELVAECLVQDRRELILLVKLAVHLDGENDGIGRGEEGVLSYRLENVANRDLRRERVAVRDGWLAVVSVPNVDCGMKYVRSGSAEGRSSAGRTLDAPAALLQRTNIPFDRTLTLELAADQVGLRAIPYQLRKQSDVSSARTLWLELMKYSGRGRVMSCLDSSLIAALSDDMRKETKPSSVTVFVAASAYLRKPREMARSSSLTCGTPCVSDETKQQVRGDSPLGRHAGRSTKPSRPGRPVPAAPAARRPPRCPRVVSRA